MSANINGADMPTLTVLTPLSHMRGGERGGIEPPVR